VICGWIVTESGRQPWVAQGIQRTADAVSPVPAGSVLTTLVLFIVVYGIIFSMGIYYINRLIRMGPMGPSIQPSGRGLPSRPLSAAEEAAREALGG
jgi:cytochrome d ubiquinol oxidase subunit I